MGNGLFASGGSSAASSIVVHIPPGKSLQQRDDQPDESARLREEIDLLVERIRDRDQDVNIVFTGPVCIGATQFCDHFANSLTNRAFRFVDGNVLLALSEHAKSPRVARWGECFQRMEARRQHALDKFVAAENKEKRSLVLHSTDLARDTYVYKILSEIEHEEMRFALRPPTPSQPLPVARANTGPRLRVFYQNPGDYSIAMARASRQLGYLDQQELESLEVQGELAWAEAARVRSPSNTLYVYLQYDDLLYSQAYAACMEGAAKRGKDGAATLRALEQLQRHAQTTKACMDELYSSQQNDIVSKYFSVIIRFEALQLLSPLHELVVCREVLSYVHSLQVGKLWNAPDHLRLKYLGSADWIPMRVRTIPLHVTGTRQLLKEETEKEFRYGTSPLPRAHRCAGGEEPEAQTPPAPVPRRVQEIREDAGVTRSPSLPAVSSSPPPPPTQVYGSGTIPRSAARASSVKPVVVGAGSK